MEMKNSDICDRWTILRMKAPLDDNAKIELVAFEYEVKQIINSISVDFIFTLVDLAQSNAKIWEQEAAIRKEYSNDPSSAKEIDLQEIGRRAILIREHNKKRITAKSTIDKMFIQTSDVKVDHASS